MDLTRSGCRDAVCLPQLVVPFRQNGADARLDIKPLIAPPPVCVHTHAQAFTGCSRHGTHRERGMVLTAVDHLTTYAVIGCMLFVES